MLKITFDNCERTWIRNNPKHPQPYLKYHFFNDDGSIPFFLTNIGHHTTYNNKDCVEFDDVEYPFPRGMEIDADKWD